METRLFETHATRPGGETMHYNPSIGDKTQAVLLPASSIMSGGSYG